MSDSVRLNCEICHGSLTPVQFAKRYISLSDCVTFKVTDKDYGVCLPMVQCARCGLVQTKEILTTDEVVKLYNTEDPEYLKTALARGRSNYAYVKKILGSRFKSIASVFEIGAGSGAMLQCFKEDNHLDVSGIEPNTYFCDFAEKNFNIMLQNAPLERMVLGKQYDLVVGIDVIEHVISLQMFMETMAKLLKPGGQLVIVTPDRTSLVARILGTSWWHIRPPHLSYLSPANVIELARQQNFLLLDRSRFGWKHTVGYLLNCAQVFAFKKIIINFSWLKINFNLNTFDSMLLLFQKK